MWDRCNLQRKLLEELHVLALFVSIISTLGLGLPCGVASQIWVSKDIFEDDCFIQEVMHRTPP